ncbi:hypothetical protein E2C01_030421 [Portunus trituberculatus]|uniref:Uncharacterized protein n=1 Tax=Portunus trituberculatus TaxID=210409 RepID=A0A5B7EVA2_PORTR|nr:hypothetical protein [Portunus trituberculatus]
MSGLATKVTRSLLHPPCIPVDSSYQDVDFSGHQLAKEGRRPHGAGLRVVRDEGWSWSTEMGQHTTRKDTPVGRQMSYPLVDASASHILKTSGKTKSKGEQFIFKEVPLTLVNIILEFPGRPPIARNLILGSSTCWFVLEWKLLHASCVWRCTTTATPPLTHKQFHHPVFHPIQAHRFDSMLNFPGRTKRTTMTLWKCHVIM